MSALMRALLTSVFVIALLSACGKSDDSVETMKEEVVEAVEATKDSAGAVADKTSDAISAAEEEAVDAIQAAKDAAAASE